MPMQGGQGAGAGGAAGGSGGPGGRSPAGAAGATQQQQVRAKLLPVVLKTDVSDLFLPSLRFYQGMGPARSTSRGQNSFRPY